MGNSASQQKEEESHDANDDALDQEHLKNHHPPSDDIVFSSQIISSVPPAYLPPHPRSGLGSRETRYSSSPASRRRSSQASTPTPGRRMSSPSAPRSSMDLTVELNQHETPQQLSKKKKRNKKRQSSASRPDEDHPPEVPQPSLDFGLDGQQDRDEPTGEVDGNVDISPTSAQLRSQHKKERRESRRAAKLARQQAEATSTPQPDEEESRFREIWLSQERRIIAKREREEEEHDYPGAHAVETVEHIEPAEPAKLKKRKRKSLTQAEDEPQQVSKKHKKSHNGTPAIGTEDNEQTHNGTIEEVEASNNGELDFNDLAEQLYTGRKRKTQHEATDEALDPAIVGEPEPEESVEAMDIDDRVESDLIDNGLVESEADSEVEEVEEAEEVYRDDDIDDDYTGEQDDSRAEDMTPEPEQTNHTVTTRQLSASLGVISEPTQNSDSGELVGSVAQDAVANNTQQNGTGINGRGAPSDVDDSPDDVEIPSSVPYLSSAADTSTKRRSSNKNSNGRKRVAKPDFFTRMVDDIEEDTNPQSPSTAVLSRRTKGKNRQMAVSDDEAQAGPSTAKGKARQHKITSILKDSPGSDAKGAVTPKTESVVRMRTPRTPVTLSGTFSEFEIRNLTQAIERFTEDNSMTQEQVNELIHSNPKESRASDLWERIIATCPGRSRQKVINQTRRRFHNFVARGTWTVEQDEELRKFFEQYGNKYAMIGQFINRHPEDIRDRVRNYIICGDKLKKDIWSQGETDKLVAIVEQAIGEIRKQRAQRHLDDSRPVEEDINWQLVSQGMGRTRSRLQCISKWKATKAQLNGGGLDGEAVPMEEVIQQARETATTMSYRNRALVIKEILKTGANADSRIPWLKVRIELGGQWTRPPLMVVWFRLRRTLSNWQSLNVKETCSLLTQRFQETHKLEYPADGDGTIDYEVEYRDIEYKIKKGRKSNTVPKSAAFISGTASDEEREDESTRDQLEVAGEEEVEDAEAETSPGHRKSSVDLSVGNTERVIEDSEPDVHTEVQTHSHRPRRGARSGRRRVKSRDVPRDEIDDQSSDTNASQVESIPAR
ncbi:hypothetical protein F4678DRAFT_409446 [Xylaria arbuscula]|nr:hypothetical protein F4678DRAFT_409446 [Xylaria arbuscula]